MTTTMNEQVLRDEIANKALQVYLQYAKRLKQIGVPARQIDDNTFIDPYCNQTFSTDIDTTDAVSATLVTTDYRLIHLESSYSGWNTDVPNRSGWTIDEMLTRHNAIAIVYYTSRQNEHISHESIGVSLIK